MPPFAPSTLSLALVTGAARGIGAAVARAFAATGAAVALLDQDDAVRDVAADLGALALVADIADAGAVEDAVARVEREAGPIGALANVAGVLRSGAVLDLDDTDWQACLAVNATGVWNTGRAVGRRMRARGSGSIVTVASNAAAVPRIGMGAYAASKAAAVALTRCLGLELAPHVRCNVVCPGSTDTAMLEASLPAGADTNAVLDGVPEQFRVGIPLGRIAEPADVAAAVLFLSGPAARHITLQSLTVDGGAALGA
ncbi:MAG TPA: SDR family oxidoreductase [Pseudonocardia sp.]|nr:SDR family oxidoreductase [Pseudonocardia sp.]